MTEIIKEHVVSKFKDTFHRISYSKYKHFNSCELSWFISNFVESKDKQLNHRYALPGTIIQRIFEEIINKRIYKTLKLEDDFNAWIKDNVYGLFDLMAFELADQYKLQDHRNYFYTSPGLDKIKDIKLKYPLFSIDTGIFPNFIDFTNFLGKYDTLDAYKYNLYNTCIQVSKSFISSLEINLDKTNSEIYLEADTDNLHLSGRVDFIEKEYMEEDYFLFDGKMNLNGFVDREQLIFYSYLIYLSGGKRPYKLGFLEWNTGKFKAVKLMSSDYSNIKNKLSIYKSRSTEILDKLQNVQSDYISTDNLYEILNYTPSFINCKFCQFNVVCSKNFK